jgi:hypothetical protein
MAPGLSPAVTGISTLVPTNSEALLALVEILVRLGTLRRQRDHGRPPAGSGPKAGSSRRLMYNRSRVITKQIWSYG